MKHSVFCLVLMLSLASCQPQAPLAITPLGGDAAFRMERCQDVELNNIQGAK